MIPFKTSFESTPTLRSSKHNLSNFSGVSLLSMLKKTRRDISLKILHYYATISYDLCNFNRENLPSHFPEDCILLPFFVGGVDISSSASRRYPSLNARTWGLPQELAEIDTKHS